MHYTDSTISVSRMYCTIMNGSGGAHQRDGSTLRIPLAQPIVQLGQSVRRIALQDGQESKRTACKHTQGAGSEIVSADIPSLAICPLEAPQHPRHS
jgi:hypothetical protein